MTVLLRRCSGTRRSRRTPTRTSSTSRSPTHRRQLRSFSQPPMRRRSRRAETSSTHSQSFGQGEKWRRRWRASSPTVERARRSTRTSRKRINNSRHCRRSKPEAPWYPQGRARCEGFAAPEARRSDRSRPRFDSRHRPRVRSGGPRHARPLDEPTWATSSADCLSWPVCRPCKEAAEARRAGHGRSAEAQCGRGISAHASEPRLRCA